MKEIELPAKNLLLTEQGEKWLQNFDDQDKQNARELASHLTLVSGIEFERKLLSILEAAAERFEGPVALFGARELAPGEQIFDVETGEVHSTPRGVDIGSEGRIATIIRNLARNKNEKFLNHPSIAEMRSRRCNAVFFVDDFIGSGKRVRDYITSFYASRTIKSWFSYKEFKTEVYAYSGTENGIRNVKRAETEPRVEIVRSCPTISTVFWSPDKARGMENVCKRYARRKKMGYALGFGKAGALLVFEHSCPNNCPQIFWGDSKHAPWDPLFVGKAIDSEARAVFPPEIMRRDPVNVLIAAGEHRIAKSAKQLVKRPLPAEWLAVLSLFSRGIRKTEAVEGVTGMCRMDAAELIEKCITAGLVTQKWRLTDFGRQELRATQKITADAGKALPKAEQVDYYPFALRSCN